jgi:hypothetical protein
MEMTVLKKVKNNFSLSDKKIAFLEKNLKTFKIVKNHELRSQEKGVLLMDGPKNLKTEKYKGLKRIPASGRSSKLTDTQKTKLLEILGESPKILGYESEKWTTPLVREMIRKKFGVEYSGSNVKRLLNQLVLVVRPGYEQQLWFVK